MLFALFDQLDHYLAEPFQEFTGQPLDQSRLVLTFFAQYVIGWVFYFCVSGRVPCHLFQIVVGFTMQFYVYRWDIYHVFLLTGVSYLLMLVLPRNQQHKYVMAWTLGSLCYNHGVRMYYDFGGYGLDISTFTMLQVCKLSALAFCYKDGGEREENLTKEQI